MIWLYIFFIFSILNSFLWDIPFTIGGSGVWTTDIVAVLTLSCLFTGYLCLTQGVRNYIRNITKLKTTGTALFIFVCFLFIPLLTGVLNGYYIPTVLRDARLIPIYLIPFAFVYYVRTKELWFRYVRFILLFTLFNVLLFYIMFFFNIKLPVIFGIDVEYQTINGAIPRYGISTAVFYYPLVIFIIFNVWANVRLNGSGSWLYIILISLTAFSIFFFSMRSLSLGVLAAFIVNLLLLENLTKFIKASMLIFTTAVFITAAFSESDLMTIPQVERHLSLIDPAVSSENNKANRQVKLDAIRLAYTLLPNEYMGAGFGDPQTSSEEIRVNKARWWNHSSIAWAIYKLGFAGAIYFLCFYLYFIVSAIISTRRSNDRLYRSVITGSSVFLLSLLGLSGGTNVFFRGDFLTMAVAITMGIILSGQKLYAWDK